ncbi:MAG: class I adenylate-forming enzyme family protein [Gammaproteobacteria bacterium]|nr:class I adenylate-forming enzyme family protein [Gammaproteobacteria bacterium]
MNSWIEQSVFARYWQQVQTCSVDDAISPRWEMPARWLARALARDGERIALHVANRSLSYREFTGAVECFAERLHATTQAPVFGICTENPYCTLLGQFAAARLGRALLPLDRGLPSHQRNSMLYQSGCRLVVCDRDIVLPVGIKRLATEELLGSIDDSGMQSERQMEPSPDDPQRILLIVPTSGTCSSPKGVMLSAINLATSAHQVNQQLDLQAADCWLNCLPLSHIAGLAIPLRCFAAGAAMVLHQGFDEGLVWQDLERHQVTHLSLVPAMLGRLLDAAQGRMAPSSLRVVLVGGGSLDASLAQRAHAAGWPLVVCYGMTETGSMCVLDRTSQAGLRPGRVGEVMPGFDLMLSDDRQGEIWISGDAVMAGYVNPRLQPGDGLQEGRYKSGDLGYLDDQDQLCLTGRADDQLNSGGLRLHPAEVERLLDVCPGLTSAAVSSRSDPIWGDRLVLLYQGRVSEIWLDAWVRLHLPSGLRPREFVKVDALPRNRLGKLDRKALRQCIPARSCLASRAAPWVSGPRYPT